jgi:NAD(P)-dependent dehydrogenase (short-subunit alcohol dehydrogenase family)
MSRIVVITGVARGIGAATAGVFSDAGWTVIGIDRHEPAPEIRLDDFRTADLADASATADAFRSLDPNANLRALVNNAAVQVEKGLLETTVEEWDVVMATNLRAPFLAIQAAHRFMGAGAAVVNVASVHAYATSYGLAAYAASKGGLVALTRAAALELMKDGIRVNAIVPGAVDTAMLHAGFGRAETSDVERLVSRTPAGRLATPREIGEAILFLCDERRSAFVVGQTLIVDGGALANLSTE